VLFCQLHQVARLTLSALRMRLASTTSVEIHAIVEPIRRVRSTTIEQHVRVNRDMKETRTLPVALSAVGLIQSVILARRASMPIASTRVSRITLAETMLSVTPLVITLSVDA
jgi:hypothetical protein